MSAAPAGLETPWTVNKILGDLQRDTGELDPVLRQMKPQQWCDQKGASTTYITQWQSAQQQLRDVMAVTKQFAQKTESLPLALDTYFRLEALEVVERTLAEGAHRYDSRAVSDKLDALIAHNFNNRERIRDYLRDLATTTEENFKIADQEAQRCRSTISREPVGSSGRKAKKE